MFLPRAMGTDAAAAVEPQKLEAVDAKGLHVDLPSPPEELRERIHSGKVRFEFYDSKVIKRPRPGETKFEYRYEYESRSKWKLITQDGQAAIQVSVRYQDIKLERTHRISLPEEMIRDDLFQKPLTLHEFDHVAISSDKRLPALLESMLIDRNALIVKVLNEEEDEFTGKPSPKDLSRISKQFVKDASDEVFNDFVEVVSIRYRELDRISNFGLEPLSSEERQRLIETTPDAIEQSR